MATSKKIAFISAYNNSFVKRDREILGNSYEIINLNFTGIKKGLFPFLSQFGKIFSTMLKCDIAYVWFADIRAFFSGIICKILRKKMLVVVGGYEMANHPEINYGAMISPFSRWRVKKIFQWSTKILVVDESLKEEAIAQIKADPDKIMVLPTGFDPELFLPGKLKENSILLVASAKEEQTLFVKGIYNYLEVTRQLPQYNFILVGIRDKALELLRSRKPDNLTIKGFLQQNELIEEMQKAKVYCQLSLREGLPNALCEAMMCNCIPVGTNVNGIPHAIGDTGFLVAYGDITQTANYILQAMQQNEIGQPRKRIKKLFPKMLRVKRLEEIIETL